MVRQSIPPNMYLGHVHLKVANLERALTFYLDVMGFELVCKTDTMAFVSAGGYHHRIGLNTWESKDVHPPAPGTTGLYHFAINYPTRRDLAVAYKRILDHGWSIDGAADHTSHEAIYLHDPDENGLELAWDRDPGEWPRFDGKVQFSRKPLDFASLLAELDEPDAAAYLPLLSRYK